MEKEWDRDYSQMNDEEANKNSVSLQVEVPDIKLKFCVFILHDFYFSHEIYYLISITKF